ncbi:hypothetical protein BD311DRAFT_278651, partial [Dichomitus squalens]
ACLLSIGRFPLRDPSLPSPFFSPSTSRTERSQLSTTSPHTTYPQFDPPPSLPHRPTTLRPPSRPQLPSEPDLRPSTHPSGHGPVSGRYAQFLRLHISTARSSPPSST